MNSFSPNIHKIYDLHDYREVHVFKNSHDQLLYFFTSTSTGIPGISSKRKLISCHKFHQDSSQYHYSINWSIFRGIRGPAAVSYTEAKQQLGLCIHLIADHTKNDFHSNGVRKRHSAPYPNSEPHLPVYIDRSRSYGRHLDMNKLIISFPTVKNN